MGLSMQKMTFTCSVDVRLDRFCKVVSRVKVKCGGLKNIDILTLKVKMTACDYAELERKPLCVTTFAPL